MKKHLLFLFFLISLESTAQQKIEGLFQEPENSLESALTSTTSQFLSKFRNVKVVSVNPSIRNTLYNDVKSYEIKIQTRIETLELIVEESTILGADFKVVNSKGQVINVEMPTFYKGKVKGVAHSFVSLSVSSTGIEGVIATENSNYTIGKIKGSQSNLHVIYNSDELPNNEPFECKVVEAITGEDMPSKTGKGLRNSGLSATSSCERAVDIYFEVDYRTYQDNGSSIPNTATYVGNIFNNVAILYDNEDVNILLNSVKVWDAVDPYNSASSPSAALNIFDNVDFSHTGANLAHLLSTRSLGGGVAYLYTSGPPSVYGGMSERSVFYNCARNAAYGVSASLSTAVIPVPTWSWTVSVVAHELGHNFGLPHTHSCNWPGGAIDGCTTLEGTCTNPGYPPTGVGGTIMSYCHFSGRPGINFANGFGTHPGNKMRAEVAAATCLNGDVSSPIVFSATRCDPGTMILTASGCSGTYNWFNTSSGGTSLGTGTSFTTPHLTNTTTYYVNCTNSASCTSTRRAVFAYIGSPTITTTNGTGCNIPVSVTLTAAGCTGGTYNWYSSPAGGSSLGTGSTFLTPLINITTDYYVSCTIGSCVTARVVATAAISTVCEPCLVSSNCSSYSDMITLVEFLQGTTSLNAYSSTCSSGGFSYTSSPVTTLERGIAYNLKVENPAFYSYGAKAWIDYNRNGVFESPSEEIFTVAPSMWTTNTRSFTVPVGTTPGLARVRVRLEDSQNPIPCQAQYGETEDYLVDISGSAPCPSILALAHPADSYSSGTQVKQASSGVGGSISATNRVTGTAKVTYESRSINLNPGFIADNGSVFLAQTGGCN